MLTAAIRYYTLRCCHSFPSPNLVPSGATARLYLWGSLSGRVRAIGWAIRWTPPALLRAVALTMVAMVVARQLEWLYNQLKVPTVSWIPYIPINLSSDRPWSRARSSDSNWCHFMYFFFFSFFSPLRLAFPHGFEAAVQGKKTNNNPSSFLDLMFFIRHPSARAMQHKNAGSYQHSADLSTCRELSGLRGTERCGCCPFAQRTE